MCTHMNYSFTLPLFTPGLAPAPSTQPLTHPDRHGKEAEVDALTSLLVQSMDSSNDPEFFGEQGGFSVTRDAFCLCLSSYILEYSSFS